MDDKTIVVTGKMGVLAAVVRNVWVKLRSPGIALFLRNIGVTFIFKALSLVISLIVSILCVRELGVVIWGQLALIASVANIVLIPLTFGLYNGVVKYVPVSTEEESRELMGTALIANLVPSSVLAILLVLVGPVVEDWFGLTPFSWFAAVALAMSINLYILTESFLRGQQQFFRLGVYKLLGSLVLLAGALIGLYLLGAKSMSSYLIPLIAQNLFFFMCALRKSGLKPLRYSTIALKKLFSFGFFIMLSWLISALLFTSDLFLLARFGTQYDLGVYSVYQNTIRGLCTILFHDVFALVFLPMIAALDKRHVDRIIMKYCVPIVVVIWFGTAMLTTILILLYGKSFPLNWTYVALTSAGIAMNMMYLLMTSVISLEGVKAARWVFAALCMPIPALLYLQYMLVKHWGMIGGMSSVIVLNVCLLITLRIAITYFYRSQPVRNEGGMFI